MDDWLSREWADHHARFSTDLSGGILRIAIYLKRMASAGFRRRTTRTHTLDAGR